MFRLAQSLGRHPDARIFREHAHDRYVSIVTGEFIMIEEG